VLAAIHRITFEHFLLEVQIDKETESKILSGNYKVVYTTPEKFFDDTGNPTYPFRDLINHAQIGLIAIIECH